MKRQELQGALLVEAKLLMELAELHVTCTYVVLWSFLLRSWGRLKVAAQLVGTLLVDVHLLPKGVAHDGNMLFGGGPLKLCGQLSSEVKPVGLSVVFGDRLKPSAAGLAIRPELSLVT